MTVARSKRTDLVDVRELREAGRFEIRAHDSDILVLEGYASTFEPYEMYGGPARGGWIEQLGRNTFDKTLRERADLHLLINHEGAPLARTKSGTLKLSVDNRGLFVRAELDRSDPDVQRLEPKMRRGDMDEMSFAFRVKRQEWSAAEGFEDDVMSHRMITEVSLHKGDVSVVNFGANPTTSAELLGKRKGRRGARKTLSRAEAHAVMLADDKKRHRPAWAGSPPPRMTRAEALRVMRGDEILNRAPQLLAHVGDAPMTYRSAVERELFCRSEFDTAIAQLRHRREMRSAIGRSTWEFDQRIREMSAREHMRRQRADIELEQLLRREATVEVMKPEWRSR